MNNQLQNLYHSKWNELSSELQNILNDEKKEKKPTNPLLLKINERKYSNADIKIMIFGQETNDWEGDFNNDIGHLLQEYDNFFNSQDSFSYGGQFWNGYSKFITLLQERFPNSIIESVWSNVIKIGVSGRNKNKPPEYIYNTEKECFNVIQNEIAILQPDVILFLSGPYYDNEIIDSLPGVSFNALSPKYSMREIAKLQYNGFDNMYRTYHPGYLWRNDIDAFFNEVITDIKL